jgi:hypothetical protein
MKIEPIAVFVEDQALLKKNNQLLLKKWKRTMNTGRRFIMNIARIIDARTIPARTIVLAFVMALVPAIPSAAQTPHSDPKTANSPSNAPEKEISREFSGMYTFLKDGEFVQISVEDEGRVTGFVSRYGEGESDKGAFLDQYFRTAKLDGHHLSFVTETVHGVWFEFNGTVERGEGKTRGDEAYYILKGTLTANSTDAQKKLTSHPQEVALKMFPAEASPVPSARN